MDRFVRGFIIGVVAGLIKNGINWFSYSVLHFTKKTYAHFMTSFLLGREAKTGLDLVFAQIVEVGFGGLVGVAFIYFAYRTKNKENLWFKGGIFGSLVYGLVYNIGTFFRITYQMNIAIETAINNIFTSSIFGVLLGLGVYWWGKKIGDFGNDGIKT